MGGKKKTELRSMSTINVLLRMKAYEHGSQQGKAKQTGFSSILRIRIKFCHYHLRFATDNN
jgi:hypothetical protein